jgi:hypothetical protein
MRLQYIAVAGLAVSLCLAAPALAQTKPDEAKPNATATQQPGSDNPGDKASGPSTGAQKQHTQAGANFKAPQYGTDRGQGRIRQ